MEVWRTCTGVELRFDPDATRKRRKALQEYYDGCFLQDDRFICESFGQVCKPSARKYGFGFYQGQSSYLGNRYDLLRNGVPLRLAVCGISTGRGNRRVTIDARTEEIAAWKDRPNPRRNPHMRGTTLALRYFLLGENGLSMESLLNPRDERVRNDAEPRRWRHLYRMFALPNFVLCSAVKKGSTLDKSTYEMRDACARHYFSTLKRLAPTIVVLQGAGRFKRIVDVLGLRTYWHTDRDLPLGRFTGKGLDFVTCDFNHPYNPRKSLRWASPDDAYFKGTVLPTLRAAAAELGIV